MDHCWWQLRSAAAVAVRIRVGFVFLLFLLLNPTNVVGRLHPIDSYVRLRLLPISSIHRGVSAIAARDGACRRGARASVQVHGARGRHFLRRGPGPSGGDDDVAVVLWLLPSLSVRFHVFHRPTNARRRRQRQVSAVGPKKRGEAGRRRWEAGVNSQDNEAGEDKNIVTKRGGTNEGANRGGRGAGKGTGTKAAASGCSHAIKTQVGMEGRPNREPSEQADKTRGKESLSEKKDRNISMIDVFSSWAQFVLYSGKKGQFFALSCLCEGGAEPQGDDQGKGDGRSHTVVHSFDCYVGPSAVSGPRRMCVHCRTECTG